jgi:SagB-type dehydrogenase family enzyme
MNKNLQMVYTYHNETKHTHIKYARSLGYMDWATQPDPYRSYADTKQTILPLALKHNTLAYHEIFESSQEDIAPLCLESISQFFQFSLGLAAVKSSGGQSWDLRCNASSGNLQPTESYLICDGISGIDNGIHHYAPKNHNLEQIANTNEKLDLPNDSFLVALSSIVWREAWKYGERSWRYTQLDCGHALRALEISAYMLGWQIKVLDINDNTLNDLIGLNQSNRYINEENENADMLLLVSKYATIDEINYNTLRASFNQTYLGYANQLSPTWHKWDILNKIEEATTQKTIIKHNTIQKHYFPRKKSFESKDIVLNRRSAQQMDAHNSNITLEQFDTIISSVSQSLHNYQASVHLVLFVHDVNELDAGLYILLRNDKHKDSLMQECKESFLWQKSKLKNKDLYLLKKSDYTMLSKTISCNQSIASNGAFSLGMLAQFDEQLSTYGASRYKELYWECGAIGQQLYLEATSLSLSATGIGCYLDDIFHDTLGLTNMKFQSLYHFTIGRGIFDSRLSTLKPYENRM